MAQYVKTGPFVNGAAPAISATFLNNVETALIGIVPSGGDDTTALQTLFTAAAGTTIRLNAGVFLISSGLTVPSSCSLVLDPNTTIRATATINGPLLTIGDGTNQWQNQAFRGGVLDCNNYAQSAALIRYALNCTVADVYWRNPTLHGLILGSNSDASTSHELIVEGCKGDRTIAAVPPNGSYGVWAQNAYDSTIRECVVVGAQRSFRNDVNGNTWIACHGYGIGNGSAQYPFAVFSENASDSEYTSCYADTPLTYGWEITANAYRTRLNGGMVYLNNNSPDNVVIGVHTANANPNQLTITGVEFFGQTTSNRLAKDYDGNVPNPGLTYYGCLSSTVTNVVLAALNPHTAVPTATNSGASGAGSSPPAPVLVGNTADSRGSVTFGTGTSPAAGVVVYVTFSQAYQNPPIVHIVPRNYASSQLNLFVQATSTTSFAVTAANSPAASQSNSTYAFDYTVIV